MSDDRQQIRELIENWAVWRDAGDWERFATVWHDDGVMMATWFQGPAADFIRVTQEGWAKGVQHPALPRRQLDRSRRRPRDRPDQDDDLAARRRSHGVLCDVVCTGRFYDFLEKRDGRWGMVLRQPIYEKDRVDPVDPAAAAHARPERAGANSRRAIATSPTSRPRSATRSSATCRSSPGPRSRTLYARGARWLAGETPDDPGATAGPGV